MVNILKICCQQRILNFNLSYSRKYSTRLLKNASIYCTSTSSEILDKNPSSLTFLRNVRTFSKNKEKKSKYSNDEENKNEENRGEGKENVVDIKFNPPRSFLIGYLVLSSFLFFVVYLYKERTTQYTGEYSLENFLQNYLPTGEVKRVQIFPKLKGMIVTLQDGAIINGKTVKNVNIAFKLDSSNNDPDNIIRRIREKEAIMNISESERIPVITNSDTGLYLASWGFMMALVLLPIVMFFKIRGNILKRMAQKAKAKNDKKQ
uniref:FtsH_ext domain-containing protein n=1 Tax=Strongyloides papillosus TaxID=174720 RepID=A0A0N5CG39_STREA